MQLTWTSLAETVMVELAESGDEGRETDAFAEDAAAIFADFQKGVLRENDARQLLEKMRAAPSRKDYPYDEPEGLAEIKAAAKTDDGKTFLAACDPVKCVSFNRDNSGVDFFDKVYGAWLGRCAGCLLGQPVEGWYRERISGLLHDTNNFPINRYLSSNIDNALRKKYQVADKGKVYGSDTINWVNNISCAPEDDDTNYTVLYLKIFEKYGRDFTSENIAMSWLDNIPFLHVCTAERVAYRNFANGIMPPDSGSYQNAYREWIGAMIRADFFGYICPGNPELAAEYAYRDGVISHIKNGVYGEMFVAAMIAYAPVIGVEKNSEINMSAIIYRGLYEIPQKSRLRKAVENVLMWYDEGITWEAALQNVYALWDEKNPHHWCHVIANAMICTIALLWGGGDFEKSAGIAVSAGFDTDCNAATVGSITGMLCGAEKFPDKWKKPLGDTLKSGIDGFPVSAISELAKRTIAVCRS
jgi:ADP-ribosylglycohydrolase